MKSNGPTKLISKDSYVITSNEVQLCLAIDDNDGDVIAASNFSKIEVATLISSLQEHYDAMI